MILEARADNSIGPDFDHVDERCKSLESKCLVIFQIQGAVPAQRTQITAWMVVEQNFTGGLIGLGLL